jgi:hypothetical protein
MNRSAAVTAKKPYQAPKLLIYGNLTEMTQAAGNKQNLDGGLMAAMRKTGR